ncbi:hypothetical protein [Bradyrhizobium sp. USDA 4504]
MGWIQDPPGVFGIRGAVGVIDYDWQAAGIDHPNVNLRQRFRQFARKENATRNAKHFACDRMIDFQTMVEDALSVCRFCPVIQLHCFSLVL